MGTRGTHKGHGIVSPPRTSDSPSPSGSELGDRSAGVERSRARQSGVVRRQTKETTVEVTVDVDGTGSISIDTGLPFFDHMLAQLGRHSGFDLHVEARGDLAVDAHHTVEDVGIVLGQALAAAIGDKAGIRRFASIALPLDEALVEVALDVSGRPFLAYGSGLSPTAAALGDPRFDPQLAEEFWRALVGGAGVTLHIRVVAGVNTHHVLEASFKAVARCLRDALRREADAVPSTKGVL